MFQLTALLSGVIFGFGLSLSGMLNPAKVIGFLDVSGDWDATLAFVMLGALVVMIPGYQLVKRRQKPLLANVFSLPTRRDLDKPLVIGSALFGIGWGLAGICPGPAIAGLANALATGAYQWILFIAAMLIGMLAQAFFSHHS